MNPDGETAPSVPAGPEVWRRLQRLRQLFLSGGAAGGDYWQDAEDLAAYDAFFAQRIAWKWQHMLAGLARGGWRPPEGGVLLDWGCGSGVAGRAVLDAWGAAHFSRLAVWDRSPRAVQFALGRARARFPGLPVATFEPGEIGLLVLSHVLNELSAPGRQELLELAGRARSVLWVEPGTSDDSRRLIAVREELRARGGWRIVAPCPHGGACGVLTPDNAGHWCHFHAEAPAAAFADPEWARFAQELGIDRRGLPYSYLIVERGEPAAAAPEHARLLGRSEVHKAHAAVLACSAAGVQPRRVLRRAEPERFRQLRKGTAGTLQPLSALVE